MPKTHPIDELRAQVLRMLDTLDARQPIAATVLFKIKKKQEALFARKADALAAATTKLPGARIFNYHQLTPIQSEREAGDAIEFLIYEEWGSRAEFRTQWNSEHLKGFQYSVGDLVVEGQQPYLRFYDVPVGRGPGTGGRALVLKTGQKGCWDSGGFPIPCCGSGQDGAVQAGAPHPTPRYLDKGNGTVTDQLTGLTWLKNANLFGEVSWDQALANAGQLADGGLGLTDGSKPGDWRLPNVNEMQSLLELNNDSGPAIAPDNPFINLHAANYWTSTSVALAPPLGWFVALAVGPPVFDLKFNIMRMWPVRGGERARIAQTGLRMCFDSFGQTVDCSETGQDGAIQAGVPFPSPRFADNGDGTVADQLTGLIWLKNANAFGVRSWDQALQVCNSLASGSHGLADKSGAGEWRLPNVNELRSLIDYANYGPALPSGHPFTNVRSSLYWSSTSVASAPNLARFVFVGVGPSVWDHKSVLMGVWPVKGGQ